MMFDKIIVVDVPKDEIQIGRSDDNDIVIPDSSISRQHCLILKENNRYFIKDLGSHNGTFIDGTKVEPNTKVEFLKDSLITVSKINLKISESITPGEKISETTTMTMAKRSQEVFSKNARLELNQESITLKKEKENKIKGPKNPASEHFKSSYTKPNNAIFSYLFFSYCLF